MPTIDDIRRLVAIELGTREVAATDHLVEDLGVTSMDLVSIVAAVEDKWGLALDDAAVARLATIADLHAQVVRAARAAPR